VDVTPSETLRQKHRRSYCIRAVFGKPSVSWHVALDINDSDHAALLICRSAVALNTSLSSERASSFYQLSLPTIRLTTEVGDLSPHYGLRTSRLTSPGEQTCCVFALINMRAAQNQCEFLLHRIVTSLYIVMMLTARNYEAIESRSTRRCGYTYCKTTDL
jgi:hypothetical protein